MQATPPKQALQIAFSPGIEGVEAALLQEWDTAGPDPEEASGRAGKISELITGSPTLSPPASRKRMFHVSSKSIN